MRYLLILILFLSSCSKYYLISTSDVVEFSPYTYSSTIESVYNTEFIYPKDYFLAYGNKNASGYKYGYTFEKATPIYYAGKYGYLKRSYSWPTTKRISKRKYQSKYKYYFSSYNSRSLTYKNEYFNSNEKSRIATPSTSIPVKKYNSSSSYKSSGSGNVQVKGYYRKNGTYVKPYTRSAPRRR